MDVGIGPHQIIETGLGATALLLLLSAALARADYGVVLTADETAVDATGTAGLRARMRAARAGQAPAVAWDDAPQAAE